MRKGVVVVVALVLMFVPVFAGTYLMNDTGQTAYSLRVTFSEPVTITGFGDALTNLNPTGEATEFTFSGGELEAWGGHWLNWEPTSVQLLDHQWIGRSTVCGGFWIHEESSSSGAVILRSAEASQRALWESEMDFSDIIEVTIGNHRAEMPLVSGWPRSGTPSTFFSNPFAFFLWGYLCVYYPDYNNRPDLEGSPQPTRLCAHLVQDEGYSDLMYDVPEPKERMKAALDAAALLEVADPVYLGEKVELPRLHVDGKKLVDEDGQRLTLRGAVSCPVDYASYGKWRPLFRRDLVLLQAWGANAINIPIMSRRFIEIGAEKFMSEYLDLVIQWAGELGLYVILHWKGHGDPADENNATESTIHPSLAATFEETVEGLRHLSYRYQRCPWVMYAVWNETAATELWDQFSNYMTTLVDVVRLAAPETIVFVPGVNIAANLISIVERPLKREGIVYVSDVYQWVWNRLPWREEAALLLEAGYPLAVLEWGFADDLENPHYATRESYSTPFLAFCKDHGISWTAHQWIWSPDFGAFMDYESTELTELGHALQEELAGEESPRFTYSKCDFPDFIYDVVPTLAVEAGCSIDDRLNGSYPDIPMTILEALPAQGWVFDHWEGPVDWPDWKVVSVDLRAEQPVRCVFRELPETREARLREEAKQAFIKEIRPVLEEWVRLASERMPVLEFHSSVQPSFHKDGQRPLTEAAHWGDEGTNVQSLRLEVADGFIKVLVELREEDRVGDAGYIIACKRGNLALYFFLRPAQGYADARFGLNNILETYRDELWLVDEHSIAMVFPVDRHAEDSPLLLDLVEDMQVTFEVEYFDDTGRELFCYPGSVRIGTASKELEAIALVSAHGVVDAQGHTTSSPTNIFVIDDLQDKDFLNGLSGVWGTYTESEYKSNQEWHFESTSDHPATSLRMRHVSTVIGTYGDSPAIKWTFDDKGWVQLRTWLCYPENFDANLYTGLYLVLKAEHDIGLIANINYRDVDCGPRNAWTLQAASCPLDLVKGKEVTVVIPFSEFKLDNHIANSGSSLLDIDRSSIESIGLIAWSHGQKRTIYLRELGFCNIDDTS
jgi:hypothetical protein